MSLSRIAIIGSVPITPVAPGAPVLLSATPGGTAVTLDWEQPSTGGSPITSFTVLRGTTSGAETSYASGLAPSALTYTDEAITADTAYYYVVQAVNAVGTSPSSNELSATPGPVVTAPPAPTMDSATPGNDAITLEWAPNGTGGSPITYYNLLRSLSSGAEASYATGLAGPSYVDTGVTNGTEYFYTLEAVNAIGTSSPSNEVSATPTSTVPGAPLLVATAGNGTVGLGWVPPSSSGGSPITHFLVYRGPTSTSLSLLATIGDVNNYTDNAVVNGTEYFYVVHAQNSTGTGPASNVEGVTPTSPPSTSVIQGLDVNGGANTVSASQSLASTLKMTLTGFSTYTDGSTWSSIEDYNPPTLPAGMTLLLGVDLTPNGTGCSAVPGNATAESAFKTLAAKLPDTCIVRLGWEYNIATGPWGAGVNGNTPALFVAAWTAAWGWMKAVNPNLRFDLCGQVGITTAELQSYYPAAAPPDFIGVDIYDGNSSQNLTFSGFVAAANFATSKGVPISCGEWGMCTSVLYDDPRWVDLAHEFFTNPTAAVARYSGLNLYRVGYWSYFNDPSFNTDLTVSGLTNSRAEFQADFGGAAPPPPPPTTTAGFKQPVMAAPAGPHLKGTYTQTPGTGPGQMFWQDTFQTGELNQSYWRNTWGDLNQWGNDPGYGVSSGTATVAATSAGGGLTCAGGVAGPSANVVTCVPLTTPLVVFPEAGWYIQIRFKLSAVDTFFPAFWFPRGGGINTGVQLGCELDWFEGGNIPENTLNNSQSHSDYNGDQQSAWGPFRTADHQWPFNFGGATSGTDSVDFAIMGMEFRPAEKILNYYAQSSPSMNYPDVLIAEGQSFPTGNPTNTAITSTFANLATPTSPGTVGAANYVFGITPQGTGKMYIAEVQAYMLP